MPRVYINQIEAFLPNEKVDNDAIESVLGKIDDKPSKAKKIVLRSNGIKSRYYVLDKTGSPVFTNAQITAGAVRKLHDFHDCEILACATTIPDQIMPNHTLMVQGELGIDEIETLSASGICLSGINALKYCYYAIKSKEVNHAVSTASEAVSPLLHASNFDKESDTQALEKNPGIAFEKDFLRWMLSDGAGAMKLASSPNPSATSLEIAWIDMISYAGSMPTCMYCGCYFENGQIVSWKELSPRQRQQNNIFAITQDVKLLNKEIIHYTVTKPMKQIAQKRDLHPGQISYFLPHYSSTYFRDKVYAGMQEAGMEITYDKWFTNLRTKGNTGSASIYIMLEELVKTKPLRSGEQILCYIPESGRFSTAFMLLKVV
ncbi:MAG: beta-ketoacyl-ACP synthase III [Campylobacterota bacterium]